MKMNAGVVSALLVVAVVTNVRAQFLGGGGQQGPGMESVIDQRFAAADVDHNGKLTKEEAKAGMPRVYAEYEKIDLKKQGYVTLSEVKVYLTSAR